MRLLIALAIPAVLLAQLDHPKLGFIRAVDGSVHLATGVAGSIVVSRAIAWQALEAASSDQLAIVRGEHAIQVFDLQGALLARADTESGEAVIGFSAPGDEALVAFPASGALLKCGLAGCAALSVAAPSTDIRAIALAPSGAALFATGSELIRMRLSDGATLGREKLEQAPGLVRPDGRVISAIAHSRMNWMGSDWTSIRDSAGRLSAHRLSTGQTFAVIADSQLALVLYDGSTETPLTQSFDLGSSAARDAREFRIRARNTGDGPATISQIDIAGDSFAISNAPSLPYVVAPQNFAEIRIRFTPSDAGAYSAVFSVDGTDVILRAAAVASPAVSVDMGGVANSIMPGSPIDFGAIQRASSATRTIQLANGSAAPMTLHAISVSGDTFRIPQPPATPLQLAPGGSASFDVVFQPEISGDYHGALAIDLLKFNLVGVGFDPPLPSPTLDAGGDSLPSAKQQPVRIPLAAASEVDGNGTLKLEFRPSAKGVTDDDAVRFLSGGARQQSLHVAAGDSEATIGADKQVLLQTGTTAGTIVLTMQLGSYNQRYSIQVDPAKVNLDSVQADRRPGQLDITMTGFDNTRTAGQLSFTFYDLNGKQISPGAIQADATSFFQQFYTGSTAGGGFVLRAVFPVSGDASQVVAVDAQITNAAGSAKSERTTIP